MAAADEAQQAAVIDVELYLHTSHPNWERAHARGRSLLDMAHGMGASFVGGATAFLVPLSIVMWSAVSDWDSVTSDRWVSLGVYLMVVGLLTTVVAMSQRRLAAVATQYLALLMEPLPTEPPDDA
jgi:hypothetical protein